MSISNNRRIDPHSETRVDYKIRINKVFDYIEKNLDADLSLSTVSEIAFFSPFHFHRIFKSITGETVGEYITRRRVEKAASVLIHKNTAVGDIYLNYGFKDNSSFTRTFKKFYGVSPTEFRRQNVKRFSKIRQLESKNGQIYPDDEQYLCIINNIKQWIQMNAKIEIKEIQQIDLACVSTIGHSDLQNAYQKLIRWATPIGLLNENTKMVTVYHDSFKVTEAEKVRMDACMILKQPAVFSEEVKPSKIEIGRFIIGSFEITHDEFEKSWTGLFIWMNENGYKKADRNPFELYHNNYQDHPEKKAIVDFYIPVH